MFEVANRLAGVTAAATSNPLLNMGPSNPVLKTHRHSKFPSLALLLAASKLLLGCQSQQTWSGQHDSPGAVTLCLVKSTLRNG